MANFLDLTGLSSFLDECKKYFPHTVNGVTPTDGNIAITSVSNATSATKLATARTFQTNLASTSTASFDGSANVTPGVTGILTIANGGTGATTKAAAQTALGLNDAIVGLSVSGKTITYTQADGGTGTITTKDTVYSLPAATSSTLGGVKIGSNITVSSGTISLTKANVTSALGYTPPASASGLTTNSNITVTKSTQGAISPSMSASFSKYEQIATFTVNTGIGAGTYTLQTLLQQLVNRSHTHSSKTISGSNCNCNCDCNCDCGDTDS